MVFCTEFLDGWWSSEPLRGSCVRCGWCRARHHPHRTHDSRSGSEDHHPSKNSVQKTIWCRARYHPHRTHDPRSGSEEHHPSKNSVQKTICCNSTSNAPDDGCMYPKQAKLRIYQQNYLVASNWHSTLFHEEDARPNSPQIITVVSFWLSIVIILAMHGNTNVNFKQNTFTQE